MTSVVADWLAVAKRFSSDKGSSSGGSSSSVERCVSMQGLEKLCAAVAGHADLYVKFPKTSGKALKHFVFKQRAVLAGQLTSAAKAAGAVPMTPATPATPATPTDGDGDDDNSGRAAASLVLGTVLRVRVMSRFGVHLQVEVGGDGRTEEFERELFEALVNAAVADANDGEQKDSRDDEDDGDAAELAALMLSL